MKNAIQIKNLTKNYSEFSLKIDELKIPAGLITGLIGENGAGKTTLIKLILNIIKRDSGEITIFNKNLEKEESIIKEDIGIVLEDAFFNEILTPRNINSVMKGIYKNWDRELFYMYLKNFQITDSKILKDMSKGMKKKVEIATALAHHPKLLILDEPTSGLDPVVRNDILDLFLDFIEDENHSIIFSTHITSDLEHISDYIVFIDNGKIKLEKSKDKIIDNFGILKCNLDEFDKIDKSDIVSFRKNKYTYEILINDREIIKNKYKNFVVDKITIEDLMLLMIKGRNNYA